MNLTSSQLVYLVVVVAAFGLLVTERLRNDVVAVLIVLALAAGRVLGPRDALSGFSSEPAIVVAAIFVLSAAVHHTGLSESLGAWIGRLAGGGYTRAVGVLMSSVALLSAFTHHVTTTAVMLPVTLKLSRERNIPASRLLMPLSFAASLGTTITIIGAPAFLIASALLRQSGRPGLGIFSIAPIGLALSAVGTVFMMVAGRFLLPALKGGDGASDRFRLNDYFTELTLGRDSQLLDKTIDEVEHDPRYELKVVGLMRRGRRVGRELGRERLVVLASVNVPLDIATLAGAGAVVVFRCISIGQAYRAIDAKIFVFIAGAIPLGVAMEKSGTAKVLAGWLTRAVEDWSETATFSPSRGWCCPARRPCSDSSSPPCSWTASTTSRIPPSTCISPASAPSR
jgi:di/tricarboxylate transporter